MILGFRGIEELFQEIRINKRDKELNNQTYQKYTASGQYVDINAANISVGDVIKINDERVPADVIILAAK